MQLCNEKTKKLPIVFVSLKDASIGAGSTLLCGITVGRNSMIGAGSIVTKDIPAGEIWYGSPACKKG